MLDPATIDRGWSAADVDLSELVDDTWIAANTIAGKTPSTTRHLAARTVQMVSTFGKDPLAGQVAPATAIRGLLSTAVRRATLQKGGFTKDQMRRIAVRTGYPYVEAWSGHNKGAMTSVDGALIHHTGTPWTAPGDYPTLRVVRDGRADLINSLCAFGLGRSGTTYLISPLQSWHAGKGNINGLTDGNGRLVGIEAESDGVHWTDEERDAYPRLVASILVEIGMDDTYTTRHATYALPKGRKTDTGGLDMDAFWTQVYFYLAHPEFIDRNYKATPDKIKEMDMAIIITANTSKDGKVKRGPAIKGGIGDFMGLGSPNEQANARKVLPEVWVEDYTWDAYAAEKQTVLDSARATIETRDLQRQILAAINAKA